MKNKMKTVVTAVLATALVAGVQMTAFAATSVSEADASTSAVDEVIISQADSSEESASQSASSTAGTINQSPNTGMAVAPFTAILLAAAAVPVMLGTRKKK